MRSLKTELVALGYTSIFCVAIALLIKTLGLTSRLDQTLVVSFSIGLSVHLSFILLGDALAARIGPILSNLPITLIGLAVGLTLGGWLIADRPLLFFSEGAYGTLVLGLFFAVLGFIYFATRGRLAEAQAKLAEVRAEAAENERLRVQADLKALQAQIEPHFLFNTLSNISSLIHTDPARAEATLQELTQFLRATLRRTRSSASTLGDELQLVRSYLAIQQTRMGERLAWEINADPALGSLTLPPLLLQPLVENAVLHAIEPQEAGGEIEVRAWQDGSQLHLIVRDNGPGLNPHSNGSQLGLANIRDRLRSLYGDQARLTLTETAPSGLTAGITLPVAPG